MYDKNLEVSRQISPGNSRRKGGCILPGKSQGQQMLGIGNKVISIAVASFKGVLNSSTRFLQKKLINKRMCYSEGMIRSGMK